MFVTDDHALVGPDAAEELRDRTEIVDALYRFGLGQDLHDRDLFASAFTEEATLDFGPAARNWGSVVPVMRGRDAIVDGILVLFAERVATTHQVTNPRIRIIGDRARLSALVEAQHLLVEEAETHALLKNLYDVELVRDGHRWVITAMTIHNTWWVGDPRAIFEPAPRPSAAGSVR